MKRRLWLVLVLVLVVVALAVGVFFVSQQSVLSVSSVRVEGGKVFWLYNGLGDSQGEVVSFTKPGNYTLGNGDVVIPQRGFSLSFDKGVSECVYQLRVVNLEKSLGLVKFSYFSLDNPVRNVRLVVSAGGVSKTLGVSQESAVFKDVDGKGEVVVQTLGLLPNARDCPESSNVAIYKDKGGNVIYAKESDLVGKFNSINLLNIFSILDFLKSNVARADGFVAGFEKAPVINEVRSEVVGEVDVGSVQFTASADQDYFDSVVYSPPKLAKPVVRSVVVNDVVKNSGAGVKAVVENTAVGVGKVLVEVSGDGVSVSPKSQNVNLEGSQEVFFSLQAGSKVGKGCVTVKACGVSQFSSVNCDSREECFEVLSDGRDLKSFCGDGVCDANENNVTCVSDCLIKILPPPKPSKCEPYWSLFGATVVPNLSPVCLFGGFFVQVQVGGTVLLSVVVFVLTFLLLRSPKYLGRKKDVVLLWVVTGLVTGAFAFLIYTLFWVGVIGFVVYLVVRSVLKRYVG